MARFAFHGPPPQPPGPQSWMKRISAILFPPKPKLVLAAHYPRDQTTSITAITKVAIQPASTAHPLRTRAHYRPAQRTSLERAVVALGSVVFGTCVAYWALSRDEVVITKRHRTMGFSWDFEKKLFGERKDPINDPDLGGLVTPDDDLRARAVLEIARRILDAMKEAFPSIYKELEWDISVRAKSVANAFYRPGGHLVINTGIVDMIANAQEKGLVESSRDALAVVIAHELAHGTHFKEVARALD